MYKVETHLIATKNDTPVKRIRWLEDQFGRNGTKLRNTADGYIPFKGATFEWVWQNYVNPHYPHKNFNGYKVYVAFESEDDAILYSLTWNN
jgi:hypothetical protein